MTVRVSALGLIWTLVVAVALTLYGIASWRSGQRMQTFAAVFLFAAAAVSMAVPFVRFLQTDVGAALRVAFASAAFLFRSLALVLVGSAHSDRTGQLIGAGTSACFAVAVVLMRLQYEVTMAAAVNARTD